MATFAIPKKSSYIVKKNSADIIINSKLDKEKEKSIKEDAEFFIKNNLINNNDNK